MLTPLFISDLGPPTTKSSYSGLIQVNISEQIDPLVAALSALETATKSQIANVNTSSAQVVKAIPAFGNFTEGMVKVQSHTDDWLVNNQDQIRDYWNAFAFLMVAFGILISVVFIFLLSAHLMQKKRKTQITAAALIMGALCVVGMVGYVGVIAGGIVVDDACAASDKLGTINGIKELSAFIPDDIAGYVNICLNSANTNLANANDFGSLSNYVVPLNSLNADFETYMTAQNAYLPNLSTLKAFDENSNAVRTK